MSAEHNRVRLRLPREGFELAVDLQLPGDGITVLFGASGSGKTSVLRCVAGLERPLEAVIRIAGETWQDDDNGVFLPTWRRALGYVFQESTLFPHLDVRGNLEYGLRRAGKPQVRGMLDSAVELLGIGDLLARRVERLSGGERQRVAIARALATAPRLLVLDEPLSSLDQARRREILPWLERLRDELRTPMLYVTHFADEVAKLADHLVVLERGQVRASAPAAEVLSRIIDPVLLGDDAGALLEGVVAARDEHWQLIRVAFAGGDIWLRDTGLPCRHAVRLRILARDVSITTAEPRNTSIQNHFPCIIDSMAPDTHPSQVLVRAACGESMLLARITGKAVEELRLRPGGTAWLQVKSVALIE